MLEVLGCVAARCEMSVTAQLRDMCMRLCISPRRMAWRSCIVVAVVFCLLGFFVVEAFHQHGTEAEAQHCVLCQMADHQPFSAVPPPAVFTVGLFFLLYFLPRGPGRVLLATARRARYRARAPPVFLR